ncbi:MAG: M20/M25/M40 family metallo-hydrolase, partial [Bacteroidales bacterium]|nr:M20/M25/M40 family metallo-hydrolase [Bacteroidales bacterium]
VYSQQAENYGSNDHEVLIKALHAVSEQDISDWMHVMISPEKRGRLAGDIGYDRAAGWAAGLFEEWGLEPFFEEKGFFQEFPQPYTLVKDKGMLQVHVPVKSMVEDDDAESIITKSFTYGDDYWPWGISGSGELTAEVVYAGHGLSVPELGYDDYAGIDVNGKIVIVELGIPYTGNNQDTLLMWAPYVDHSNKVHFALEQGAAGLLFAYHVASPRPTIDENFLFLAVTDRVVDVLLAGTGKKLDEVREHIKSTLTPMSFSTGKQATMALTTEHFPDGKTANVVAMIRGSDPVLQHEYMIIGAHLDHLGMMPVLFPGALDNASGCALALGVARALTTAGAELKRSLVIILFGAEEVGLRGARHFVEHFPYDRDQIKFMINLDMVGRGNAFFAVTADIWSELLDVLEDNNDRWVHRPFLTRSSPWQPPIRPRTDGMVFYMEKIPAITFGTRGAETRALYHVPEDTMDQINIEIMRDVIKLLTMSILEFGN